MSMVTVQKKQEQEESWEFEVRVDEHIFHVVVDRNYWKGLTDGKEEPESFVKRSFEFLLEREPVDAILNEFNLRVIETYFPEYEEKIAKT